ncbi:SRPBCC family protein [Gordonia sp. w5E2]|uniref:Toxin n=1 Tax=Gordonia jacobaea TaxID=122202 RepID=A0ABR5IH21_9ACTN|nr:MULTISPECIES: SRPBCC family protein [Gordonia]KNA92874.1 toxin [Gordonia jacobaea]OBC06870.1 toxin [Gordonia sp. 852002-50816_SCH5313054-a]OBC09959.1 toxin [Gordonia sp. 852002-50395_SCH5434458]OBC13663.1 toxin [Gordonia sp. 852002-50816_SCH5313054-c]
MAKTSSSIEVDLSPEDTWSAASDLSRYSEWLLLHDGWRSPIPGPGELEKGTKVSSVVKVKGTRIRFDWVVETYDPTSQVRLKGNGKGGIKAKLDLAISPTETGSSVVFTLDLGGLPLIGPAGKAAAMAVSGDLNKSLDTFAEVFA